jgi:hypothetical protein
MEENMENDDNELDLMSKLSYDIVKDVAPEELDLFDDIKQEFLKNADAFKEKDQKKREKMTGFAFPTGTEQIVTTVILPVVLGIIKKYFPKKGKEKLDIKNLKKLRDEAYNMAISLDIDKSKANLLADSLIGKIVQYNK